jgi:hypothetical protein
MNKINKPAIWIGAIRVTWALLAAGLFMLGAGQRNAAGRTNYAGLCYTKCKA